MVLCRKIAASAKAYHMRIIGPNSLGVIQPSCGLNASFADACPCGSDGVIAFASQSGALCAAILDWACEKQLAFSSFVSIGAQLDVDYGDLIDLWGSHESTRAILIYMESITNAKKFLSAARAFARTKPIIVLKAGKSAEGAVAAKSHTGSIAGNDAVYDAAFKRVGILRVNSVADLFDSAHTLTAQKRPQGDRLCIVTNAGGLGVISTDTLVALKGKLATLSSCALSALNDFLPSHWSHANPVDVLGDASPEVYRQAVSVCLEDENVDGILVILTPQAMTNPSEVARQIISLPHKKILLASWVGGPGVAEGVKILEEGNIPNFSIPERAVACFMLMASYARNLENIYQTPEATPFTPPSNPHLVREIISSAVAKGKICLNEVESKTVLSHYGIAGPPRQMCTTAESAANAAMELGFPVALKIVSANVLHKTEVGGVKIGLSSAPEVQRAFTEVMESIKSKLPDAVVDGILVERMVRKRHELLIGCHKDTLFGPAIAFGAGGVTVEVVKDINIALPPLNMALAMRLIEETRIYQILKGCRGIPAVDVTALQATLVQFSRLVMDFPEIQDIDVNPFAVDETGFVALDAKIILDRNVVTAAHKPPTFSHLVIHPYPQGLAFSFKLKNGKPCSVRAIRPEDERMEAEMFDQMSQQTQLMRFLKVMSPTSHDVLVRYTQVDYDREIALVALVGDEVEQERMAGVARFMIIPGEEDIAEFAIVVADPWQNQGIGNRLCDSLLHVASEKGVKTMIADVQNNNKVMLHMLKKKGFQLLRPTNGNRETTHAQIEL
ncbi:acetyl-coenzym A synthetase, mitochondrial [Pelomyxa schiedti]|nr:acetyl-coenzym A synthetase, mitochondrial [Pelomyxa schiedti]